jgi:hypothetical protein
MQTQHCLISPAVSKLLRRGHQKIRGLISFRLSLLVPLDNNQINMLLGQSKRIFGSRKDFWKP